MYILSSGICYFGGLSTTEVGNKKIDIDTGTYHSSGEMIGETFSEVVRNLMAFPPTRINSTKVTKVSKFDLDTSQTV